MFGKKTIQAVSILALIFFSVFIYFIGIQHHEYHKNQYGVEESNESQVISIETCDGVWPEQNFANKFVKPIYQAYKKDMPSSTLDYESFHSVAFTDVELIKDEGLICEATVILFIRDINKGNTKFLMYIKYSPDMNNFSFNVEKENSHSNVFESALASLNRKQFVALYRMAQEKNK